MRIPFVRKSAEKLENNAPQKSHKLTSGKRELTFLLWRRGLMAAILMAALVAGTAAWITVSRTTGQRDLQVTSDSADLQIQSYNIYRSIWDDDALEYVYRDVTGQTFTLNGYDAVFGKNGNTPAYLRIRMVGDSLEAGTTLTFHLTRANTSPEPGGEATNTNGLWKTSTGEAADYLSNIVQISAAEILSLSSATDPAVIYPAANAHGSWSAPAAFATTVKNASNKTVLSTKADQTGGTSVTLTQSGEVVVFLKLDYKQDLIMGYLNSRQTGSTALRLDKTLTYDFTGDLTQLVIEIS